MLIALASAHRAQTIRSIDVRNITFTPAGAEILIKKMIKPLDLIVLNLDCNYLSLKIILESASQVS